MKTAKDVLDFWFPSSTLSEQDLKRWFSGGEEQDIEIQNLFLTLHKQLRKGLPQNWPANSDNVLAAIIVIDQFSRNLFRGSAQAFEWDSVAIELAQFGWDQDLFQNRAFAQQAFSLLPFVHSEQLDLHEQANVKFEELANKSNQDPILTGFLSSAKEHRAIIETFGRYPHRNEVLSRASTPAEIEYLESGAKRFGQ
jgi:uncharacterized protein (DUF924 family)